MPYRKLDPERIIATADLLQKRIAERFPEAGLARVAGELASLARDIRDHARKLQRPIWWLRALIAAGIVGGAAVFVFVGTFLTFDRIAGDGFSLVQGVEATINTLVLAGLGFFTLIRLEERFKRNDAFKGLHGLRSVIHIIDMHQLTKDPGALQDGFTPPPARPSARSTGPSCAAISTIVRKCCRSPASSPRSTPRRWRMRWWSRRSTISRRWAPVSRARSGRRHS